MTISIRWLTSRGTYCLLVVATLLDLITPELIHNVDKFIASCQTYEGGFACSTYGFETGESPSTAEAHGGYTSCSLNAYFLLSSIKPPAGAPSLAAEFPRKIDVDGAMRWAALMQGEAIEAGGFRGRSNKLVDGCYSWWVGGGVPVIEELSRREREAQGRKMGPRAQPIFNHSQCSLFSYPITTDISRFTGVCAVSSPTRGWFQRWLA